MKNITAAAFFLCLFSGMAWGQAQIIAQIVDGEVWQTTIVNEGRPLRMSTSTVTCRECSPSIVNVCTRASIACTFLAAFAGRRQAR